MKRFWMFSPVLLLTLLFLGQNDLPTVSSPASESGTVRLDTIQYPAKVKAVIDAKCYDCHSEKGDDEDAKEELLWDNLNKLSKMDQLFSMDAIIESIEDGEMPPEDHIKKHPEAALSKEEAKLLTEWADAIASKLME
ncbi:heme-binding domain-containing protein [Flavilitoribacter nigricans]|uniref:Haem-binding domain-containing protein n=1 Tax=Flavilitoribacter nigricans (strain ATCC 23147 / DSM 23189 / NBRC 102662 / NCIMB 1420 / SS-2) TaxID=1122177 RepID=A0A2D0NIQ3_FLAN2|nr:heme-binding domain-containing protein [Flavilitoribacter nigricans]PHN08372.1 hypothetical protein CRP01_00225 [Flavilitoribacter nigricans DSM 23189 = NBRC 102662]